MPNYKDIAQEFQTFLAHADDSYKTSYLTDQELEIKEKCEESLYEFVKHAWPALSGSGFIDGWHIEAICAHLEALYDLQITDLIINQPFRTGKSMLGAVFFPAWGFTQDPAASFLFTSYSQRFATRDSIATRRLMQSDWYQRLWGHEIQLRKDMSNKLQFETMQGGYRLASSVDAANTGGGADTIVTDDPNNIREIQSKVIRLSTNDWWDYVMPSRYRLLKDRRRLVIQQRCHEEDLSGHILAKDDPSWVHLCLPMEFEKANRCMTIPLAISGGKTWADPRTKEGELLWPAGVDAKGLARIKKDFNYDSYVIAGQLQQRPSPAGGGILKRDWFRPWRHKEYPHFEYILQSWDTALTGKDTSAYNACTTWGIFKENDIFNVMLLSLYRERIEYPELRKMAVRLAHNYRDIHRAYPLEGGGLSPDIILIEEKATGHLLLNDFMAANLPVMRFNPGKYGDKEGRCMVVSHLIENGLVWLPTQRPKCEYYTQEAQTFLEAAELFPNAESNDIIDSMSQAFIRLKNSGWLYNKEDPQPINDEPWKNDRKRFY